VTDPQRPATWKPFRKNLCDGCWGACCTLPLEVSLNDLVRLGLVKEKDAPLKEIARDLQKRRLIESFSPAMETFTVAQRAGRDCIFLDEESRLCTVYDVRPEVCRKFPLQLGPRQGFCPHKPK